MSLQIFGPRCPISAQVCAPARTRRVTTAPAWLACAGSLFACAAPPEPSRNLDAARAELALRAEDEQVAEAFARVPRGATARVLPPLEECVQPAQRGYWLLRAVAHSPDTRAALREWRATAAEARSAGVPNAVSVQVTDHEFGGEDKLVEAVFMFDVLGHLGVGPKRAERARASAAEALAYGALERAVWDVCQRVERARVRLAAARAREAAFLALAAEARGDLDRVAILERHGRIGEAESTAARAALADVERRVSEARSTVAVAVAELAVAAGVPSGDEALAAVDPAALDAGVSAASALPEAPPPPADWDTHPLLLERRLAFAVSEAEVRRVAASAWPSIGFGPHFARVDEVRIGGMLQLGLPFPASWRGRLEAALERREAAIDAYENALLTLEARNREGTARAAEASARLLGPTRTLVSATTDGWRASRASVRAGRGTWAHWIEALGRRSGSVALALDESEAFALAGLDIVDARGPAVRGTASLGGSTQGGQP